ncbi:unnamed protein product [Spirodela intermedia]|uniref:Maturase K n=1 Tax=Spirodela intermedia TaxID=51605 RepID=A0ABN7EB87_SPIIN|nr:unnamed protein product [Spirodela intermedia]
MLALPFSYVYDHSLPHSQLVIGDVEREWRTSIISSSKGYFSSSSSLYSFINYDLGHENVVDQALISLLFPLIGHY